MFAVIKAGGKQYRVSPGEVFCTEKIEVEAGGTVTFDEVLMVSGDAPQVGSPLVPSACVRAEVVEQRRSDKIIIFKKKRRKHFRRRNGHRQFETLLRVTEIVPGGA